MLECSEETDKYGETILHRAIIDSKVVEVEFILNINEDDKIEKLGLKLLHMPTSGSFFAYGSPCYFGEYPLFLAVATNQIDVFGE
jgi:hypothetical protein